MTATDAVSWDVSVGRLVTAAALAERAVSQMARQLSGVDPVNAPYLLPLELEALVRLIRNLMPVHVRDRHLNDDVLEWTHQVRKLYAVRTAILHTVWGEPQDGAEGGRLPTWSNAGVGEHPMTVAELTRTTDRLTALCGAPWEKLMGRIAERAPQPPVR